MIRSKFDNQLERMKNMIVELGGEIELAISSAIAALHTQDGNLARTVIGYHEEIDQKEKEIEALCLRLLLKNQPVAGDLRTISSALKMVTGMERIGDQAADIAELSFYLAQSAKLTSTNFVPQMAQATTKMVIDSIDAFVKNDLLLANSVIKYDNIIDSLFDQVKNDQIALIQENSDNSIEAVDWIMVAKYLERIGDHAVNIADWVIFSITGSHERTED